MNASTLCTLLAQRIPLEQFQIWGLEIHWMDESYNTPENRAIVADVIKNYDALAAEYEETQKKIADNNVVYAKLVEIDQKSIRALRAGETDYLKKYEEEAQAERSKLKI